MIATPTPIPDAAARAEAIDPTRSFIVQAPAGSGKTGLLIQRYLALLATVDEPEEIVAITFTRKAAAEIRDRVLEALERARDATPPESAHDRKTWELGRAVLERAAEREWEPDEFTGIGSRLQARTIDSFCESLVRRAYVASGVRGGGTTVDDARLMYDEAARQVLRSESATIERVLRHLDNDLPFLRRLVSQMLGRREQWRRHLELAPDALRAQLEETLASIAKATVTELTAALPTGVREELEALGPFAARQVDEGSPIASLADAEDLSATDADALARWHAIASMLLTTTGGIRKTLTKKQGFPAASNGEWAKVWKERGARLLARLGEPDAAAFVSQLDAATGVPVARYDDAQWRLVTALIEILRQADRALLDLFVESAEIDHAEISAGAIRALSVAETPRPRHLLVDEFQDTSTTQFRLIEGVFSGAPPKGVRTLFLVGDPMQSIYRFREAEVGLFMKAWRGELGGVPLEPLTLVANFRSDAVIVDAVNETFAAALPDAPDLDRGAVPYSPSVAVRQGGACEVTVDTSVSLDLDWEAEQVLARVYAARRDGLRSVAILARNRHHLARILDELRDKGEPFRAVEFESLPDRPVVRDLRALTLALASPLDRVSWLAVLRAPTCGLSLEDLSLIGADRQRSIAECIADPQIAARLSEDGVARLARVRPVLERARAHRQRASLRESVRAVWTELGGPATVDAHARKDAEEMFNLLAKVERGGELIDRGLLDRKLSELYARPDPESDGWLEVMTIHKAKGLEFDCVILPGLGRFSRGEGKRLIAWQERFDGDGGLVLGTIESRAAPEDDPIYQFIHDLEREKARQEARRLYYVAATRARERLHWIGHVDQRKADGELAADPRSPLRLLWDGLGDAFLAAAETMPRPESDEEPPRPVHPPIRRLPAGWQAPEWAPPIPSGPSVTEPSPDAEPVAVDDDHGERERTAFGSVVHRLLERIAVDRAAGETWDAARVRGEERAVAVALARLGSSWSRAQARAGEACDLVALMLEDARGEWILSPHPEGAAELELVRSDEGGVGVLRVDRTFVVDGERWVIDYKVSSPAPEESESRFLAREQARYAPQLAAYREVWRAIDPDTPVRGALYFPRGRHWVELGDTAVTPVADSAPPDEADQSNAPGDQRDTDWVQGELF